MGTDLQHKLRYMSSMGSFPKDGPASSYHLPPLPHSTPFNWVCILPAWSTVFLSPGSVSMSLHLICIRFSTLSGSYLIPTQYAAEGNWVLRPRERGREVFGGFLNSLQYCVVVSTELTWQHGAAEVCVIAIERAGRAFANHAATAIEGLFSSPHFNITCLLVETVQGSGNTMKILMSQPHAVWGAHSVDRKELTPTAEDSFCNFKSTNPAPFLFLLHKQWGQWTSSSVNQLVSPCDTVAQWKDILIGSLRLHLPTSFTHQRWKPLLIFMTHVAFFSSH